MHTSKSELAGKEVKIKKSVRLNRDTTHLGWKGESMKKTLMMLVLLTLVTGTLFASEGWYKKPPKPQQEDVDTVGSLPKQSKLIYGIGTNFILWVNQNQKPILERVYIEGKYGVRPHQDWNRGESSAFLMCDLNLFNLIKSK